MAGKFPRHPTVTLPGFALAKSMNSFTLLILDSFLTANPMGVDSKRERGFKSSVLKAASFWLKG